MIPGVQTAIVVGPEGEQIHTDEFGRVKVQFHWDRARQYNDDSSCWVRVSQNWAGTGWGTLFIPRIGQEVIVGFLNGDPDRPIITGCVYNGSNTPPYTLPDEKTKSTIKSMSVPDSGGVNEIRFEDKAGEEQLFIQAENTLDFRAKGSCRESVGGEHHLTIGVEQFEKVEGHKHLTVLGSRKEKVDGNVSLQCGAEKHVKVDRSYALDVGSELYIKVAANILLEANANITLKVGGSSIVLTPAAIFIMGGPLVNINSGSGPPISPYHCSPETPDPPVAADTTEPGSTSEIPNLTPAEIEQAEITPQAVTFRNAAESGASFCEH